MPRKKQEKVQHETVDMPLTDLVADEGNARVHGARNIDAISASLRTFGQVEPLVVQKSSRKVIGGHGRVEAMMRLGWPSARVMLVDIDDTRAKALALAMNRIPETGNTWDRFRVQEALQELIEEGFSVDSTGFTEEDAKNFATLDFGNQETDAGQPRGIDVTDDNNAAAAIDVVQDDVPEPPAIPITQPGDKWMMGKHVLFCGDARLHHTQTGRVDVVFTDPPYGVNYVSHVDEKRRKNWGAIENDGLSDADLADLLRKSIPDAPYRFVCCDWHCYSMFEGALGKPKAVCVWDKKYFGLGKGYRRQHEFVMFYGTLNRTDLSDVWAFSRESDYQHPTQKPVALVAKALSDVVTKGARVYDPFAGSGTTLIAAEQLGMVATMCEVAPKYCDVVVKRWENLTGKKAERAPSAGKGGGHA